MTALLVFIFLAGAWVWMGNKMQEKEDKVYWANCADVFVISARRRNDTSVEAEAEAIRQKLAECGNKNECPVIALPFNTVYGGKSTAGMSFNDYRVFVLEVEKAEIDKYNRKVFSLDKDYHSRKVANQKPLEYEW